MEQEVKTPVQMIQELIAMLTTRKEIAEKIISGTTGDAIAERLKVYTTQSDKDIAALQSELSEFGDAVMGDVDRDNEYHRLSKEALKAGETSPADERWQNFLKMEQSLKATYADYLQSGVALTESLKELLSKQEAALAAMPQ